MLFLQTKALQIDLVLGQRRLQTCAMSRCCRCCSLFRGKYSVVESVVVSRSGRLLANCVEDSSVFYSDCVEIVIKQSCVSIEFTLDNWIVVMLSTLISCCVSWDTLVLSTFLCWILIGILIKLFEGVSFQITFKGNIWCWEGLNVCNPGVSTVLYSLHFGQLGCCLVVYAYFLLCQMRYTQKHWSCPHFCAGSCLEFC